MDCELLVNCMYCCKAMEAVRIGSLPNASQAAMQSNAQNSFAARLRAGQVSKSAGRRSQQPKDRPVGPPPRLLHGLQTADWPRPMSHLVDSFLDYYICSIQILDRCEAWPTYKKRLPAAAYRIVHAMKLDVGQAAGQ